MCVCIEREMKCYSKHVNTVFHNCFTTNAQDYADETALAVNFV